MPTNVIKTEKDEIIWKKAKAQAKEQGQEKNYAYIMSIYKSMGGYTSESKPKKKETISLASHLSKELFITMSKAKIIERVIKDFIKEKK